jgi:hypothetical protein
MQFVPHRKRKDLCLSLVANFFSQKRNLNEILALTYTLMCCWANLIYICTGNHTIKYGLIRYTKLEKNFKLLSGIDSYYKD